MTYDHTLVIELLKLINQPPISSIIKSKVLKLFGHTKRNKNGLKI